MSEFWRQMVHLGGLFFIIIAQFTGKFIASAVFFLIAIAFLFYSEFVRKEKGFFGPVKNLEQRLRGFAFRLDRKEGIPFLGAFWFYFALGLAFLIFPLEVATASGLILSVGDSLSTLVGLKYGKHKIIGRKSLEGSVVFFISSFLVTAIFLGSLVAFLGSISATFLELVPESEKVRKWKRKEIVNDNWIVTLLSGLIIYFTKTLTAG
jgi:dolichol kinase